jgi:hypothetical protein
LNTADWASICFLDGGAMPEVDWFMIFLWLIDGLTDRALWPLFSKLNDLLFGKIAK